MEQKYCINSVYTSTGELRPIEERTFTTNEGYLLTVIDGGNMYHKVLCMINGYVFEHYLQRVKTGEIKYPFHLSVYGIGYFGVGRYVTKIKNSKTREYTTWNHMLERAYDPKYHAKFPTYTNVTVHKDWHNFQTFAQWFYEESNYQEGWHLDKDLLSSEDKIYSKDTCIFLPPKLNAFLTNKKANSTTGYTGVSIDPRGRGSFRAAIVDIDTGQSKSLGYYQDIEDAKNAYDVARAKQVILWKERMQGVLPQYAIDKIK